VRVRANLCRRLITLTHKGSWANGICKLPSHKANDKGKNFSVNVAGNFFRCFSASCNEAMGKKGGDCIAFVAAMENCSPKGAAEKLASWYNIIAEQKDTGKEKPPHIEAAPVSPQGNPDAKDYSENTTSGDSVKYMVGVDQWFDAIVRRGDHETDDGYRKRMLIRGNQK
jgi:hypothetical protein